MSLAFVGADGVYVADRTSETRVELVRETLDRDRRTDSGSGSPDL